MDPKSSFPFPRSMVSFQRCLRNVRVRALLAGVLTFGLCTAAITSSVHAVGPAPEASPVAKEATRNLLAAHDQYRKSGPAARPHALNNLLAIAADRQQELDLLMRENPGEVLRVTLPEAVRANLPAAVQAYVEKAVQLEGTLEVTLEHAHPGSILRYTLDAGTKRVSLHFADDPPFNC